MGVNSASPEGPFLHVLYRFCSAKRLGPLITAFCVSPALSVIGIGSYFVVCQVLDRHQCETRKQKIKYHFYSDLIKKCLFNFFLNMTGNLHYGFFSKLVTKQSGPFVAQSSSTCFFVTVEIVYVDS